MNNLPSLPLNYNQQFPPKRATSVTNPPSNAAWNDMIALPVVNSLADVPNANGFTSGQYGGEFTGDSFSLWAATRSYSTGSSPALSAASNHIETVRKALKDSSTQTDSAIKEWQINEEILRDLCGKCAKRIASALSTGRNLSHSPVEYRSTLLSQFNVNPPTSAAVVNQSGLPTSNHISNGVPSHNSSSSSSTSVVSPTEDVCSLSSGTPTTIEGLQEQEGREYDPFNTIALLDSGSGIPSRIF